MRATAAAMLRRWGSPGMFLAFLLIPAMAAAALVDRVIASVDTGVITLSELRQAVAFNEAMGGPARNRKELEAETLEGLITRRLLLKEARRLSVADVSGQDINNEVEKLKKRFGSDKAFTDFLAGLDMTQGELRRMLGERLLVERFVEKKVGLFVRVSREEARKYFDNHPADFAGRRFQEVSKKIMAVLSEQKTEAQIAAYVSELRGKADIRIIQQP